MDSWKTILFLLAAGQGFLLSLALLSQFKKINKSGFFFGLILLVISIEILFSWTANVGYVNNPNAFPFWFFLSYLVLPPSLLIFVRFSFNPGFKLTNAHLLLFIPALLEILISFFLWGFIKLGLMKPVNLIEFPIWFLFVEVLPLAWFLYVMVIFGKNLYFTKKHWSNETKPKKVSFHFKKLTTVFLVFFMLSVPWVLLVFTNYEVFEFVEVLLVIVLFVMGYVGYFKNDFFEVPNALSMQSISNSPFPNYNDPQELQRLHHIIEKEALYVESSLSLSHLAKKLKLPVRYVSYLINQYHETNFRDFINSYRVQEVIRKINDPSEKHKTLLALAMESGFNSKSTFNQVFKAHTGKIPSQYF